jgi:hypothetical protein
LEKYDGHEKSAGAKGSDCFVQYRIHRFKKLWHCMTRPIPEIDVIDDETVAKQRSMTVAEKIQLIGELNRQARVRAATRLKHDHPEWTKQQVLAEIARLMVCKDEEYFK